MGPQPRPYDGMSHDELVELARKTITAAAELPPHSVERAMKFAAYDSIVNEAKRRLVEEINRELGLPDVSVPDEALSALDLPDLGR
jgi:hypothetical protein